MCHRKAKVNCRDLHERLQSSLRHWHPPGGTKSPKWHSAEMVWGQNQTLTQSRRTMHSILSGRWPLQISGVLEERGGFLFPKTEILWPVLSLDLGTGLRGAAWSNRQMKGTLCWARIHLVILIKAHQCNQAKLAGLVLLTQRPCLICCRPRHGERLETQVWPQPGRRGPTG